MLLSPNLSMDNIVCLNLECLGLQKCTLSYVFWEGLERRNRVARFFGLKGAGSRNVNKLLSK